MEKNNYTVEFDDEAFKILMKNSPYGNLWHSLVLTFKTLMAIYEEVPSPILQLNNHEQNPNFIIKYKGAKKIFYVTSLQKKG